MTTLRFIGLQPKSLRAYQRALRHFFQWLEDEEEPIPQTYRLLDSKLAQYLEHLWMDDCHITYAGHTLSAFRRFYPQVRYKIPLARQYFVNWKSIHVSRQAVPMPADVVLAIAGVAVSCHRESFAAAILLAYAAFLRTGEIIQLAPHRIAVDPQLRFVILSLPATKTSKQKDESVSIEDVNLAILVQHVLTLCTTETLLNVSANQFRAMLKLFCSFLNLEPCGFSGYSLRRGGASHAFASGQTFDQLLVKGRWQSVKTARVYLDSGRAQLIQMRLPSESVCKVQQFSSRITEFIEQLRQNFPTSQKKRSEVPFWQKNKKRKGKNKKRKG